MRQGGLWLLWIGLIVYGFGFAPPNQPNTMDLLVALSTLEWNGINPLIVALFNIMGLWPAIYAAVVLVDGRSQSIPAWPFVGLSFGLGAFALLPYLALRQPSPTFSGPEGSLITLTESRWLALLLLFSGSGLLLYGALNGSWVDFVELWRTSRFIHVTSLDFCVLSLLFVSLLPDDMARRQMDQRWLWISIVLIPVVGPALYLCWRSPLIDSAQPDPSVEAIVSLDA